MEKKTLFSIVKCYDSFYCVSVFIIIIFKFILILKGKNFGNPEEKSYFFNFFLRDATLLCYINYKNN